MIHSCRYEPYDDGRDGHRRHGEDDSAVGGVGVLGDMDGASADKGEDDENEDDYGLIVFVR